MINPFKRKRNEEVLDLVDLRKRGIIKDKESVSVNQISNIAESATGFIGDFAAISSDASSSNSASSDDLGLKNKLDDFEYKIEALDRKSVV